MQKRVIYQVYTIGLLYQVKGLLQKNSKMEIYWLRLHRCNVFCDYQDKTHQRECVNIKVPRHCHVNVRIRL